ncbi:MAG: hypothetical protein KGM39_05105 [Actinomycetales bacterium]|nr:hypothetical protein [Actinomycetales bacterium]
MNKKLLTLIGAAAALVLTACGGSTDGTATTNGNNQDLVTNTTDATGAVGSDIDLGNGVTIKLSDPQSFAPTQFASNYAKGQTANLFEATVTNKSSKAVDWATVSFVSTTTAGGACPEVLDGDAGVDGQPQGSLAAGQSATFKFGVACDTKPGAELNVLISVAGKTAEVKGKLA